MRALHGKRKVLLISLFMNSTSRYKALALHPALFQGLEVHLPPPERASRGASGISLDELEG